MNLDKFFENPFNLLWGVFFLLFCVIVFTSCNISQEIHNKHWIQKIKMDKGLTE